MLNCEKIELQKQHIVEDMETGRVKRDSPRRLSPQWQRNTPAQMGLFKSDDFELHKIYLFYLQML